MSSADFEWLRGDIATPPFHHWLRPELVSSDETSGVVVRLPLRYEFRRHPDHPEIHGGIVAALIDIAGHAAVAGRLRRGAPTIDLRIDFLRPASGRELRAHASVLKLGRSISVVDVRVLDDVARLVAAGRGGFSSASLASGEKE